MRKLREKITPLVTEKHFCHDRDMSILVAVIIFVEKKCWLITIKKKANVRLWRRFTFSSTLFVIICTFRRFCLPWFRCPEQNRYVLKQKNSKKDETCWLTVWENGVNQKIWRKKNLEMVLSWNWKQKSIFGISETKALQKKRKRKVSQVFSPLNKTTDGFLDGGIDDMRYWNTMSWT